MRIIPSVNQDPSKGKGLPSLVVCIGHRGAAGLQVNGRTMNTPEAIAHCKAMGVDGITDYPELP